MKITVFDRNPSVVSGFVSSGLSEVAGIVCTNDYLPAHFSALPAEGLVSPANSYGFMDGGIDLAYSQYFGWGLQDKVQAAIKELPWQYLPVGQAIIVETGWHNFPNLIVAPTMIVPKRINDLADIMFATRAAVKAGIDAGLNSIAMPGMGTGCGGINPLAAGNAMAAGIKGALNPMQFPVSWVEAKARYDGLMC